MTPSSTSISTSTCATILMTREVLRGMIERGDGVVEHLLAGGQGPVPDDLPLQREHGRRARLHRLPGRRGRAGGPRQRHLPGHGHDRNDAEQTSGALWRTELKEQTEREQEVSE